MSIAIPWQKEVLLDIWNRLVNKFVSKKKTKEQNRWVRKPLCTFTNQYRFKRFFFFSPIYYTDVTLNDIAYFKRLFILVMKKKKKKNYLKYATLSGITSVIKKKKMKYEAALLIFCRRWTQMRPTNKLDVNQRSWWKFTRNASWWYFLLSTVLDY
jgi:hypothetical protein